MKKIKAVKDFSWAHRGCDVKYYSAGEVIETEDEDLVKVATREGWAKPEKAEKSAPENKAQKPGENKGADGSEGGESSQQGGDSGTGDVASGQA